MFAKHIFNSIINIILNRTIAFTLSASFFIVCMYIYCRYSEHGGIGDSLPIKDKRKELST